MVTPSPLCQAHNAFGFRDAESRRAQLSNRLSNRVKSMSDAHCYIDTNRGKSVIAILGAIALIATVGGISASMLMKSSNDTARSQVSMAVIALAPLKGGVAMFMKEKSEIPKSFNDIDTIYMKQALPEYVSSVSIHPTGLVSASFGANAHPAIAGKQVATAPRLGSDGLFVWACGSSQIPTELLPEDCRTQDLTTSIAEQLMKQKEEKKQAVEVEAKRRYNEVRNEIEKYYPELKPNEPTFNQQLFDAVQTKSKSYIETSGYEPSAAFKKAATEIMYEYNQKKGELLSKQATAAMLQAFQQQQQANQRQQQAIQLQQQANQRNAVMEQEVAYGRERMRQIELQTICMYEYFVVDDPRGVELAESAKKECLSNDGRQGAAHARWRDHHTMEMERRNTINSLRNESSSGKTNCIKDYAGNLDCRSSSSAVQHRRVSTETAAL